MDKESKNELIAYFMEGCEEDGSDQRLTRGDVKGAIQIFISESGGGEDYASATDTCCRDRIWGILDEIRKKAQERVQESYEEEFSNHIWEFHDESEEKLDEIQDRIDRNEEEKADAQGEDSLNDHSSHFDIFTRHILWKYFEINSSVTYTTMLLNEHRTNLLQLLREEIPFVPSRFYS